MVRFFTQSNYCILITEGNHPRGIIHPDGGLDMTTYHGATSQRDELLLAPSVAILSALDVLQKIADGAPVDPDLAHGIRAVLASYVPPAMK